MSSLRPLRIVHVVCTDAFAGVERHVAALAAEQARAGHDVEVIGGHPAIVGTVVDGHPVRHRNGGTVVQALAALQRTAQPSVINAHMTSAELAALGSPAMWRVPVVSTRHFARPRGSRRLSRPVVRAASHRIAAQISVSQYVADHIDGSSTVIHPGVPTRADVAPLHTREPVVLMAQRLEPEKGTHLGIEAFAASTLPSLGWRLRIAGDGHLRQDLVELAAERGAGDVVEFLGQRRDVEALMDSASVLLAPGAEEGFGLTVLEAMAAGLPVVAAAGGGHLETVGRLPGAALFPPGDIATAARLLDRLAADERHRRTYGSALQELQRKHFTVPTQATATEAVYRSVL